MISQTQFIHAFKRNTHILKAQTKGLTHADSLLQPPFQANCLNWVIGHIAASRDSLLKAVGAEPLLDPAVADRYERGSEPIVGSEPLVQPLETLMAAIEAGQDRLAAAFEGLSAEDLAREIPFGDSRWPLKDYVFFMYFHDTYHTGQAEPLRQLAGVNDKVI